MKERDPFQAPPVESRRGGPAKQPLSREAIVKEALRQLTSGGIKGMSLRKVATALQTGPASLYAYVSDLDELYALVLDRALAKVELRSAVKSGWRGRLLALLESYGRVLSRSPGLAQLAFGIVAVGPNALRITEALLALLEEGGVAPATGAWAVDLLLLYVTAIVAEHAGDRAPPGPEGPIARAIASASERDYPRIRAARAHLLSGTPGERFGWAIEVLLRGILQTPRRPQAGRGRAKRPTSRARKGSSRDR